MKCTFHYSTKVTVIVCGYEHRAEISLGCNPMQDVLDFMWSIVDDETMFRASEVAAIYAIDSETGELLLELSE